MNKVAFIGLGQKFETKKTIVEPPPPPPAPDTWGFMHMRIDACGEVLQAIPRPPYDRGCAECYQFGGYIQRRMVSNGIEYEGMQKCPFCAELTKRIGIINRAKLPAKFEAETHDWGKVKLAGYKDPENIFTTWLEKLVEDGRNVSLAFVGGTGRGKSFTAYSLAKKAIDAEVPARWLHWPGFLESIKNTYGKNGVRPDEVWECNLPTSGVLVVDDLGAGVVTQWSRQIAWTLFERKPPGVTLIITSNGKPNTAGPIGLDEMIGERAASRMAGACGQGRSIFEFSGGDKRRGQ